MKIANPIYDLAFKYMMENERIAKLVLSTILEQEIISVKLGTQEVVVPNLKFQDSDDDENPNPFKVFRFDFKAEIRNTDGKRQTVLIEIQKAETGTEIKRFRTYLGQNYQRGSEEIDEKGEKVTRFYPIVTIYILGYRLPRLPYLGISIERRLIDMATGREIEQSSEFIDKLNHLSYILQVTELPPHRKTRLEKFMTLFNQAWIAESDYILDLQEVPEEFREIAEYLRSALADDEIRANLQGEEEVKDFQTRLKNAEAREEANLKLKEEERKQKEEERKQKEEERRQKEEALETIQRTISNLRGTGLELEQIAAILGKSLSEISHFYGGEET